MSRMTLTCDASAKPIGLVPMKHAVSRIAMAEQERAYEKGDSTGQVLVSDPSRLWRSQAITVEAPLVVMWPSYIEVTEHETERVSKRVLFARDHYTCQYCGFVAHPGKAHRELTMDHVKPARLFSSRQEATSWDNCTTACHDCNFIKGGRLPVEARMMPRSVPQRPHYVQLRFAGRLCPKQKSYVCDYFGERFKRCI